MIVDKKAEITSQEVVKLVLAVLGIVILIMLASGLYTLFMKDRTKYEQARELTVDIAGIEKDVLAGVEGNPREYLIIGPRDWYIKSLVRQEKPECVKNSCLCVCKNIDCQGDYVCRAMEAGSIELDTKSSTTYQMDQSYKVTESVASAPDFFAIDKVPMKIKLTKKDGGILISKI